MTITKPDILAAIGAGDVTAMPVLRQAFDAFVRYPEGRDLDGFDGPADMVDVFSRVCWALRSDGEPMPAETATTVTDILSGIGAAKVPSAQYGHAAEATRQHVERAFRPWFEMPPRAA